MTTNFIGDWSGYGEGVIIAHVHMRIIEYDGALKVYALTKTLDGEGEVIEFTGTLESDTTANLELVNYVSDNPKEIPPINAHVILEAKPDLEQLEGQFATNAGTHGTVKLRKATRWGRILLNIPFVFHKLYIYVKKFINKQFRHVYFAFVVTLTVLSVTGIFPEKISTTEAIVLLVPLIFLFSENIKQLIEVMAVKKLGPVEFQLQTKPSPELNIPQLVRTFHTEFGEQLPLFSALTEFFVPRTKNLLRQIAYLNRTLSMSEFNALARRLGVPDNNLTATLQALVSGGCISVNETDEVAVQQVGREFLNFETRLAQIYRR
ncbi:MAG: hypothetical protein IID03_09845 [Candidatus Dadabacteria bacterium]|nr:hypothetical protein [Candidatus Dadabacteria bacterium]